MDACANFLTTYAPKREPVESSFDITASRRVDGVKSKSFMFINAVLLSYYNCRSVYMFSSL